MDVDNEKNPIFSTLSAIVELVFPTEETKGRPIAQARAAMNAFKEMFVPPDDALSVHAKHEIVTARGKVAAPELAEYS